MDYVGEHLMPGKLGQFFVVLSFAGFAGGYPFLFQNRQCKIHRRNPHPGKGWRDLPFC